MDGIQMPTHDVLPPGALRDLVEAVHELYRGAGAPGLRRIARAVMDGDFRDTVSHEKVAAILRGRGVPRWSKLEPIVRVLADWNNPRLDPDDQAARLGILWQAAAGGTGSAVIGAGDGESSDAAPPTAAGKGDANGDISNRASPAGTSAAARAVGSELAARARAERRADTERGYRDAVEFARDLPSPAELEKLNRVDFDVAAWIRPWSGSWTHIAAGLDPFDTKVPDWAWKAAKYLGTLADPIGFDHFSFTPAPAYLAGFGSGLRAVYAAMREDDSKVVREPPVSRKPGERHTQPRPIMGLGDRSVGSVSGGGPVVTGDGNAVSWGDVKQ